MFDQGYYDRDKKKQPFGWKIFSIIIISLIIIVYFTVFLRFFQTCDSKESKIVYLSEQAAQLYNADTTSLMVHKLTPGNPYTPDGSFYMSFITYLENTNELQITIRYRETILQDKDNPYPYSYRLYDENGTEFPLYYTANDERQGYYYSRQCFSGLKFDFEGYTQIFLDIQGPDGDVLATLTLFDKSTAAAELKDYDVSEIK